ncbi:MAG: DUF3160 domain-containing protein [Polyangia bacterium]|jgi:hypothetical protein|nr:DUF3160 domain-containing protein [Polyangia bacterium]
MHSFHLSIRTSRAFSCAAAFILLWLQGCQVPEGDPGATSPTEVSLPEVSQGAKNQFVGYYSPVTVRQESSIEPYDLPVVEGDVANLEAVLGKLALPEAPASLLVNGFAVSPWGEAEDFAEQYRLLKALDVPVFVTADTWLHMYHVQFDELLKELEETRFYRQILAVTNRMIESADARYRQSSGLLRDASRKALAFLWVARGLLTVTDDPSTAPASTVPAAVSDEVVAELKLITEHAGFERSPLFQYQEDYSQYLPRGHYTRSETLKSYFRALMWYGRMTLLLKGGDPACEYDYCPALVTPEEADQQTLASMLLTVDLLSLDADGAPLLQLWEDIYQVTAFFVGLADDLTLYEYHEAIVEVLGRVFPVSELARAENLLSLRAALALKRAPEIYGGTGGQVIWVDEDEEITPEMLDELLEKSKGFRLMGQRFIPDSFAMGRLVSPGAGSLLGDSEAFTAVYTQAGWVRGFPRGLDVMALLGSGRASRWLGTLGDDAYTHYAGSFAELQAFFAAQTPSDWHRNLYWGWLHALQPLLSAPAGGVQSFMLTEAWQDKSLGTALASWAELRHDTILYAKQSYTPGFESITSEPVAHEVPGYVEPNPELFARLLALNETTRKGLEAFGVLHETARNRLLELSGLLGQMLDISQRELASEELSEADHALLGDLADRLDMVLGGVEPAGVKTTMVADVHTDQNSQKVLEEGVGYLELLLVVLRQPDGRLTLNAGPVLSHYEFKHDMASRLSDETWRELLESPSAPEAPPWTGAWRAK